MNSERELEIAEKLNKNGTFEFAEFSFDAREKILRRGAETVSMPPKTCDLLAVLLAHHGKLVTKDELFRQVWADAFVEDANLSHHIAVLRKALGEDNQGRKFIETVTRRGYRFVASVNNDAQETDALEIHVTERTKTRLVEEVELIEDETDKQPTNEIAAPEIERKSLPAKPFQWRTRFVVLGGLCLILLAASALAFVYLRAPSRPVFFDESTRGNWRVDPVVEGKSRAFGNISGVQFSPDGKFIAFDRRANGKSTIFVKQLNGGEPVRLTDGKWVDANPVWTADGQRIAFLSTRDGLTGVWTIPFLGGTPALLTRLPAPPRRPVSLLKISRDEKRIFYEADQKLYALDWRDAGAAPVLLFENTGQFSTAGDYAVSPDEREVAFYGGNGENIQLYTASLDGKSPMPVQITFDAGEKRHPAWFGGDRQIAYSSDTSGKFQIYVLDLASGESRQLTLDAAENDEPLVTSNNRAILFHATKEEANIYSFSLEKRTETALTDSIGLQLFPAVAPESARIAFQTSASSTAIFDSDLKILALDDSRRTLDVAKRVFNPQWSPDGSALAFVRSAGATFNLWKVSASGQNETQITSDGINPTLYSTAPFDITHVNFNWSPDGKQIVFASFKSGAANVWTIAADGSGAARNWTNFNGEAAAVSGYQWSPDGQKIVFFAHIKPSGDAAAKPFRIYLTDGERPLPVYETTNPFRILGFSETAREIFVAERETKEENGEKSVRLLKIPLAENAEPQVLARIERTDFDRFHLAPDRRSFVFTAAEERSESENLYLLSINETGSTAPVRLTDNRERNIYFSGVTFASDGKTIFYSKQTSGDAYALLTISEKGEN